MYKPYPHRHQAEVCQLPAHANQRGHEEFDLMPIQVPADAHIVEVNADALVISVSQADPFIDDHAVSCRPPQSLIQYFRGGGNVIEQSELPKIGLLRKMKSEMIVLQGLGGKIQKANLISNFHANVWVFDLVES